MPKATARKTVSAPDQLAGESSGTPRPTRPIKLLLALMTAVITVIIVAAFLRSATWACQAYQLADHYSQDTIVKIENHQFDTEVADEPEEQRKGLSGRPCIDDTQTMLFVYKEPGRLCFWMKDMRFPIDIVWLDAGKNIVSISEHVDPSTYPQQFCPDGEAQYVLEFRAGAARQHQFAVGQRVEF